jgi:aminoglycoside phosphotransferase (APT) family kinase protein
MILERIDGETIPRRILRDAAFGEIRPPLAYECGRHLAAIHRMSRDDVAGLEQPDQLQYCAEALESIDEPHPVLEVAVRWLIANRPSGGTESLVHGDFRNGNLIVGPEGIRAVLDWEVVHWGDPAEDFGYLCVKAWRFGATPPVGGFGTYQDLLRGYAEAGGRPVDLAQVHWWEVLGTVRWALSCIRMSRRHLDGQVRSVELAAIGRRTCEQEWDLLARLGQLSS